MRRKILAVLTTTLLIAALVPVAPAGAVGTWTAQDSGTTSDLFGVAMVSPTEGWVVGTSATILHTTDGGATWVPQDSGPAANIYDISMVSPTEGWVVGALGTILHTTDGGATWVPQDSGATGYLRAVDFVDADNGWVTGDSGLILHTSDGGTTWTLQPSDTTENLRGIDFADASTGWACGYDNTILATTDGGTTWSDQPNPSISGVLLDVQAVNASEVWAVGPAGGILATSDGGATWTSQTSATPQALYALDFVDAQTGWAVGDLGDIVATTDGGTTWTLQPSGVTEYLLGVFAVSESEAWAVGSNSTILHYSGITEGVSVSADTPAPTELSLTFSVAAGTAPDGGSVDGSSIDFGTLAPNTPKAGSHGLQVTTNASNGYQVTAEEDTPLTFGTYTIPDVIGDAGSITETQTGVWDLSTTYGFGYTLADVTGASAAFTSDYKQFADTGSGESPQDVMSALGPVTADAVDLSYKLNIGPAQVEGAYANTITYIATGNL